MIFALDKDKTHTHLVWGWTRKKSMGVWGTKCY